MLLCLLWQNSLSLIPFINHGKDGRREKIFYYERHEIRESFIYTTNPFHIRERNISTTGNTLARHSFNEGGGNHGEENVKRKIMVWKL